MALGLTDGFSNVPWQPTWGPEGGQVRRVTVCVWKYMAWWKYAKKLVMSQRMIGFDVVFIVTSPDFQVFGCW